MLVSCEIIETGCLELWYTTAFQYSICVAKWFRLCIHPDSDSSLVLSVWPLYPWPVIGKMCSYCQPKDIQVWTHTLNWKGTWFVFGLVGGIKSCQTLQRSPPDQGLQITHYDITAWTLMLLELQCRFRCNFVTVLHCQYRGKYLIYCVLIVLSQCEWFKLYFLKFLDNDVPTCNEVRHQWLFWNWWHFLQQNSKRIKKKLLRKCKPGYILNIKMAFDLFNEFSVIYSLQDLV